MADFSGGMYVTPAEVGGDPVSESDAMANECLEGYIALHFPDGIYYVNDTSITLGRDTRLQDFLEKHSDIRVTRSHPSYAPTREEYDRDIAERIAEMDSDEESFDEETFSPTEPRFASLEGGIATFDINLHRRLGKNSDNFLAIHPPGDPDTGRFPRMTAISKEHLRLYADEEEECWMMEVLGRNGVFVDDIHHGVGYHVRLQHLTRISVGGLDFRVAYEDVSDSELEDNVEDSSDEEEADANSDESEITPESTPEARIKQRAALGSDDSDEEQEDEPVTPAPKKPGTKLKLKLSTTKAPEKAIKDDKQPKTPKDKDKEKDKDKDKLPPKRPKETSEEAQKKIMSLLQPGEEPGRRKGPGRPPANGLMSKREMKERQKAMADAAKREKEGSTGDFISPTTDFGLTGDAKDEFDKLNNKKRKRSNTTGDPKAENGDRKKRPTPEKSPEPTEDQFTPEQLQPPGLTYVVIIYRILQDMHPQQLNLQQLYREMKKRHPYYRFRPKPGWESSVRHTVSAHNFIKGEKDGKGYKYTYNPDEPPAPQKQKQVTAPTHPQGFPNQFPPRPPQYQPGNYPGAPYSYANSYQPGNPQQSAYGQNLPLHNQRPMTNGVQQPNQFQPLPNGASQLPAARNPQNSPYPINPTVAGFNPSQQTAQGTQNQVGAQPSTQSTAQSSAPSNLPAGQQAPRLPNGNTSAVTTAQPGQQQQPANQANGAPVHRPPPLQAPASGQAAQHIPPPKASPITPQSTTPAQANGLAQPPPVPNSTQQPPNGIRPASTQPAQTPQQSQPPQAARPPSQTAAPQNPPNVRPQTPLPPTPSEELAQGKIPQALNNFEATMKRYASNMPPRQQDIETRAVAEAMLWIRGNPTRDFTPEPGMSSYTISVITNMKSMIQKQDAEILLKRQQTQQQAQQQAQQAQQQSQQPQQQQNATGPKPTA